MTDAELRAFRRRYPNWPADVLAGFVGGLMSGVILVGLLAWQAELLTEWTLDANPNCASPRGLNRVAVQGATGAHEPKRRNSDLEEVGEDGLPVYAPARAVDDASQTMWIPPLETVSAASQTEQGDNSHTPRFVTNDGNDDPPNVLTIEVEPANIRLVCVVNGATLWHTSYQNWGRVRTVRVWGADDDPTLTILQSLGPDDFPNAQLASRGLGITKFVHIELLDAYSGQRVETFNAAACLDGARGANGLNALERNRTSQAIDLPDGVKYRYEPGCILEPEEKAGLAEVYLYADDRANCWLCWSESRSANSRLHDYMQSALGQFQVSKWNPLVGTGRGQSARPW